MKLEVCDGCGKPLDADNPIAAKLYFVALNGKKRRDIRNHYTSSMDIGTCCFVKASKLGKWQKRKPRPRAKVKA